MFIILLTALTDNMLYIIGGRNNTSSGNIDTASVDRYDPLRDEWKPVKPLSTPRNRLGVATIDGHIYAIGGGNGNTFHTSVERYDSNQDEWTTMMPLNFPRIGNFVCRCRKTNPSHISVLLKGEGGERTGGEWMTKW